MISISRFIADILDTARQEIDLRCGPDIADFLISGWYAYVYVYANHTGLEEGKFGVLYGYGARASSAMMVAKLSLDLYSLSGKMSCCQIS